MGRIDQLPDLADEDRANCTTAVCDRLGRVFASGVVDVVGLSRTGKTDSQSALTAEARAVGQVPRACQAAGILEHEEAS